MKNNKKGFTLIELLAVIVILAVVALITTPIVLNLINTARKGAFTRSAEMVLKAAKTYHLERQADMELVEDITFTCDNKECKEGNKNLNVQGSMGKGTVLIKASGEIIFTLTNNNYCAVKYESSNKINIKKGNCSNIDLTNDTTPPVIKNVTVNTTTNSITIVVSAEDQESGIHHYEYSIDGGQTYEEGNTNTKTFNNLEKKDYKIKVKVYNGTYGKDNYSDNTGMAEYEVKDLVQLKNIDFPEIKVTPEEWATSKTVEIDYKGALVQEYSLDGGTTYIKYEGPFTITENMAIVAKASDGTNSIKSSRQITKIDATVPTISLDGVPNEITVGDSYELPTSYTVSNELSGGTAICKFNETVAANTSSLSVGSIKIDCTVTTGAGKSATASKTINVKQKTYTVTFDTNGGYIGNPTEIDSGYANGTSLTLAKDANVPVSAGNTISLNTNQNYMLSFDYVADGTVQFDVDLYPDTLPQIYPTATTIMQTMNWIFSSNSSDMASLRIRFFNNLQIPNPYDIRISSIHLYKCDDCTLSSSKTVTYSSTYSTLPSPKRNGYVFQGWYTSATGGTKIEESTPVTVTGNQTLYAQWELVDTFANRTYTTGDYVVLGGYKWHVIGDTGTQVTLLMDANQLGDNSNMAHCTDDTDASTDCGVDSTGQYYVYSWDKSLIRTYLNGEFLTNLESKIGNEIVSTSICADPSRGDNGTTYGGYLMSELNALGKTSNCSKQVSDKVRLITYSEYYNMSPYYTNTDSNYPNVGNITRISTASDYASWLYCRSNTCGNSNGYWWTMGSYSNANAHHVRYARYVYSGGSLYSSFGERVNGVRPVVTIVK